MNKFQLINQSINKQDFTICTNEQNLNNLSTYWKMIFSLFESISDQLLDVFKNLFVFLDSETDYRQSQLRFQMPINSCSVQVSLSINCSLSYFSKLREKYKLDIPKITYLRIEKQIQPQQNENIYQILNEGIYKDTYTQEFQDQIQYICLSDVDLEQNFKNQKSYKLDNLNSNSFQNVIDNLLKDIQQFQSQYVIITYPFDFEDGIDSYSQKIFFTNKLFKYLLSQIKKITNDKVLLVTTSDNYSISENEQIVSSQTVNIQKKLTQAIKILNNEYQNEIDLTNSFIKPIQQVQQDQHDSTDSQTFSVNEKVLKNEAKESKIDKKVNHINQWVPLESSNDKQFYFLMQLQNDMVKKFSLCTTTEGSVHKLNLKQLKINFQESQNVFIDKIPQLLPINIQTQTIHKSKPNQSQEQSQQQLDHKENTLLIQQFNVLNGGDESIIKSQQQVEVGEIGIHEDENGQYQGDLNYSNQDQHIQKAQSGVQEIEQQQQQISRQQQIEQFVEKQQQLQEYSQSQYNRQQQQQQLKQQKSQQHQNYKFNGSLILDIKNSSDNGQIILINSDFSFQTLQKIKFTYQVNEELNFVFSQQNIFSCVRQIDGHLEIYLTTSNECNRICANYNQFQAQKIYYCRIDGDKTIFSKFKEVEYNQELLQQRLITCDSQFLYLLNGLNQERAGVLQRSICEKIDLINKQSLPMQQCDFLAQDEEDKPIYLFSTQENIFYGGIPQLGQGNDSCSNLTMQIYDKQNDCWYKHTKTINEEQYYIFCSGIEKNSFYQLLQKSCQKLKKKQTTLYKYQVFYIQLINGVFESQNLPDTAFELNKNQYIVQTNQIPEKILISSWSHDLKFVDIQQNV